MPPNDRRPRPDPSRRPNASQGARPAPGSGSGRSRGSRPDRDTDRGVRRPRTDDAAGPEGPRRARLPEPALPDGVGPKDLDRSARAELRSLPETLADRVAGHLVAAGLLLDDDPAAAHTHAWYARSLAPRLAIVREAAGVTAYRTGDYAAALSELRAVRRMTGDASHLPVMADCERGLGRPERALALARDPQARALPPAAKVELGIVVSGARRDLGAYDAAVVALQGPALDDTQVKPWTARLWYAYAEALLASGRSADARRWFESVAAIDDEGETDAEQRAQALDG